MACTPRGRTSELGRYNHLLLALGDARAFCQRQEEKMNRIPDELNESNVRQICSVLESLAKRPEISKKEIEALETATIAILAVNMGKATQRAYGQLLSAHNGNIPDELRAKLQSIGFDVDTVHRDYIADTQ